MVERPYVGVAVAVRREGKILVGQRLGKYGAGAWALPGGHLEFGESIEAGAQREVLEETGMTITNIRHVDFVNSYDAPTNTHYVNLIVVADWVAGEAELREPEKCAEWRWIEWPNVPQPHFVSITGMLDAGITF